MKIKTKILYLAIIIILAFSTGSLVEYKYEILKEKSPSITDILHDTVTLTNTIRDTVLMPVYGYIHRIDTVLLQTPADTVEIPVLVPIERKEYRTEDYRAVIEGWSPSLLEMEIYRKMQYITNTQIETRYIKTKPRFGIGVQTGYGFNGQRIAPYIGIGVQLNFLNL